MTYNEFRFSEEYSASWRALLSEKRSLGLTHLLVPVFWGAHEGTPGFRDFTKSSRLRLEKFLKLANELSLKLTLRVGFPEGAETLPVWAHAQTSLFAISSTLCSGGEALEVLTVPSLSEKDLSNGFLEYIRELFSILTLYRSPEGPVEKVEFTWGPYQAADFWPETESMLAAMRARYETADRLNAIYQTSFPDFSSLRSPASLRTLYNKREWMAAFDSQACRHFALRRLRERIEALYEVASLQPILSWETVEPSPIFDPLVLVDSTLVNWVDGEAAPLSPLVADFPGWLTSYRFVQSLKETCAHYGGAVLPISCAPLHLPSNRVHIFCTRYLSRAHFNILNGFVSEGRELIFLGEFPRYDEFMEPLPWNTAQARKRMGAGNDIFQRLERETGSILIREKEPAGAAALWSSITEILRSGEEVRP